MVTQELVAEKLLWGLWRCVSDDYKKKYKKDVWEHFENAIKSGAYTGSLKVFLTNFQKRLPVDLQAQYTKDIISIIETNQDDQILDWLRSETTYLVMIVRLKNQDKKEAYIANNEEIKRQIDFDKETENMTQEEFENHVKKMEGKL